jgi:putative membrane protein
MNDLSLRTYRTFQALILAALGLFLLFKISDGRILLYINQRFVILVLLGGLGLVILSQVVLRERPPIDPEPDGSPAAQPEDHDEHDHKHDEHDHEPRRAWGLWLLALPLLIGLLIPQKALDASAIYNRGVNIGSGLAVPGSLASQIPEEQRSVLDWIQLSSADTPIVGGRADVSGFVYHDPRLEESIFLVGRFTIACCVADAAAYAMAVRWPDAQALPDNRWVRVRGTVSQIEVDGRLVPLIEAAQVEVIPEPVQPYLFP